MRPFSLSPDPRLAFRRARRRRALLEAEAEAAYAAAVMEDSPALYWPMGEESGSFSDYSGNGRPGTQVGGGTREAAGLIAVGADALAYDPGTAGHAQRAHEAWMNMTQFTFELLWKPTDFAAQRDLCGKTEMLQLWSETSGKLTAYLHNGSGWLSFLTATVLSAATVYHLVYRYDQVNFSLFINGVKDANQGAFTGTPRATANPLKFGSSSLADRRVNGPIDECAVYTTALSDARIAAHYAATGL